MSLASLIYTQLLSVNLNTEKKKRVEYEWMDTWWLVSCKAGERKKKSKGGERFVRFTLAQEKKDI